MLLKTAARAFGANDFLNIFLRFWGFWGSFSYKKFSYKKNVYNQNKLYETSDYWSRDIFKLNYSEKGLGLVSPPRFVYNFWRKIFLMLYSTNWPNFIVWLSLLLEILGSMCIAINCEPGCGVIKFEITLSFKSSRFSKRPKSQDKNLNILRMKRAFDVK